MVIDVIHPFITKKTYLYLHDILKMKTKVLNTIIMKKSTLKNIALTSIVSTGLLLGSCDLIKDLNYKVKENPLEMHGDEVDLQINATFVEKGLNAKAIVEVTPTFVCKDGTEIPFEMAVYQGAKAAGNGTVIPKEGKTVVYNSTLPYNPCMQEGELVVKLVVKERKERNS